MPATRSLVSQHNVIRASALVLAVLAALLSWTPAAQAGRPTRETFKTTNVYCDTAGGFGTAKLFVSHSETGAGFPGADLVVWEPGKDPDSDTPALIGSETEVLRHGTTLHGRIPLRRADDGGSGEGLDGDGPDDGGEIVGWAAYQLDYSLSGPAVTERVKGAVVVDHRRFNVRYRTERTRTPVTASGTLTLPDAEPVRLDGCDGHVLSEQIVFTSPTTTVASGRYPMGFEDCVANATTGTATIFLIGGEISAQIWPQGAQAPTAVGATFAEATRSTLSAQLPMVDYETGDDRGTATLSARLHAVQRQTLRFSDGRTTDTIKVERVSVTGTLLFEGERYEFDACEGTRARQLLVQHHTIGSQRLRPAQSNVR